MAALPGFVWICGGTAYVIATGTAKVIAPATAKVSHGRAQAGDDPGQSMSIYT